MSDVMLFGVLRMPPELWMDDHPMEKQARYSRYLEAADRIEQLERELNEAKAELESQADMTTDLGVQTSRLNWAMEENATLKTELSALKKQIQDGELVPVEVIADWMDETYPDRIPIPSYTPLKRKANELAKSMG